MEEVKTIKEFNFPVDDDEDIKLIVDILHQAASDPVTRHKLEIERQAMQEYNEVLDRNTRELQAQAKVHKERAEQAESGWEKARKSEVEAKRKAEKARQDLLKKEEEIQALKKLLNQRSVLPPPPKDDPKE